LLAQTTAGRDSGKAEFGDEATKQAELQKEAEAMAAEMAESQQGGDPQTREAEPGQEPMQQASASQKSASQELAASKPTSVAGKQTEAVEALKKALDEMKAEQQRQAEATAQEAKDRQDQTGEQAGELGEQMAQEAQSSGEPQPGQESVQQAQQSMSQASQSMSQGKSAMQQQKEAQEKMEQAAREMQEEIERLKDEQQDALRRELVEIIGKMLTDQQAVSSGTKRLDPRHGEKTWGAAEKLAAQDLADGEMAISRLGERALEMLVIDGSGAVFTAVLEDVQALLANTRGRLAEEETGATTQAMQADIEWMLADLLKALDDSQQSQQEQQEQEPQEPQQQQDQKQPLIDVSAQLKLLRSQQVRINSRTQAIANDQQAADDPAAEHHRLSRSQERVLQMTERLMEEMK
jgi:hypothetical protein